jgi:hypothetical protein
VRAATERLCSKNTFIPQRIEETYGMSMQSHLAELEKKHQALEEKISECQTHPAVDDLEVVELKRRKLLVKDEIERLRHNGLASVH